MLRSRQMLSTAAALMLLALPAAAATTTTTTTTTMKHTGMHAGHGKMMGETVEERIAHLHAELRITPSEEGRWDDVAQVMRDNAAEMQQMVADKRAQNPQTINAKEDLKIYQEFAQAHVDGLKHLRSAFNRLYNFMPDAQKQVADQVFRQSKHQQG